MAKLSDIATADTLKGELRFIIETPKGSRNKYKWSSDDECFELAFSLPEGMSFPFDFGFIPSTEGEDGDPLDILVLADAPAETGVLVRGRLIGVLLARQKNSSKKSWIENDRLIGVAAQSRAFGNLGTLSDLNSNMLKEIKQFFVNYNSLCGRRFRILGEARPERAAELIRAAKTTSRRRAGPRRAK